MASTKRRSPGNTSSDGAGARSAHICFERIIPDEYNPARATELRASVADMRRFVAAPSRARGGGGLLDASRVIGATRAALVNQKRWPSGSTLRCRFLDGSSRMRGKVQAHAREWEKHANIKFKFASSGAAEIRISFYADEGSWSAVGTDALVKTYFPTYQPTMNFGWVRDDTAEAEDRGVILHEFGHALGCVHEHQSPNATLKWNEAEVYRYFSGPPNFWSKEDIDHNVLSKYSKTGITATSFDRKSIMLYWFDKSLFLEGAGTNENHELSPKDKSLIKQMYP